MRHVESCEKMPMAPRARSRRRGFAARVEFALVALYLAFGFAALAADTPLVEQKGRMFQPGALEIAKGGSIRIVNNDGDLLHHAYVESAGFKFDSGEQEPGAHVDIVFTQSGQFDVLCAIHPKMRLVVTVK